MSKSDVDTLNVTWSARVNTHSSFYAYWPWSVFKDREQQLSMSPIFSLMG